MEFPPEEVETARLVLRRPTVDDAEAALKTAVDTKQAVVGGDDKTSVRGLHDPHAECLDRVLAAV